MQKDICPLLIILIQLTDTWYGPQNWLWYTCNWDIGMLSKLIPDGRKYMSSVYRTLSVPEVFVMVAHCKLKPYNALYCQHKSVCSPSDCLLESLHYKTIKGITWWCSQVLHQMYNTCSDIHVLNTSKSFTACGATVHPTLLALHFFLDLYN